MRPAAVSVFCAVASIMMSIMLSRTVGRVVAEMNCRSYPTFSSVCRTFATSSSNMGRSNRPCSVVTYSQLKTMLSNRTVQLYDVRNPDEYQDGRIADAVNVPLDTLQESLQLAPELFQEKFKVKAPGKNDDNIVFHCRSGKRSAKALDIALQLGFSRARHYEGGYSEWAEKEGK
ncbi:thiosulfate:glutathione sulfurtransferase-like [Betta splendens]|uniref:Thiosulfate:glutathione sulfurtransferase-like n=1 Tax=Betta splendens TaxID=158456 RepID=A0A6P7M8N0_BETSP|nr:thiosulfate:glutathione sulfurtransferase-like [Betta splendens]